MSFLLLPPILVPVIAGLILLLVPQTDRKLPRTALTIAALAATVGLLIRKIRSIVCWISAIVRETSLTHGTPATLM